MKINTKKGDRINKKISKNIFDLTQLILFGFLWFCSISLYAQQNNHKILALITQLILLVILIINLNFIKNNKLINKLNPIYLLSLFAISYLVAIFLEFNGFQKMYLFMQHLGSGTMLINNKIFMFGDLAQLTFAANCDQKIQIGEPICDPFERHYNQNPHLIAIMRVINLHNLFVIGIIFVILFYLTVILFMNIQKNIKIELLIAALSPVTVLALDRGNEIITVVCLFPILLLIQHKNNKQMISAVLLLFIVFFKFWPLFIVVLVLFFYWKNLILITKFLLIGAIIYWLVNFNNIIKMKEYTANGSVFGSSFGFPLYVNSVSSKNTLIFFIIVIILIVCSFFKRNKNFYKYDSRNASIIILFISYFTIWASSISWAYRLLILIPIIIFLDKSDMPKKTANDLITLILATLLTIKLPITSVMTSSLALIFIVIAIRMIINQNSHLIAKISNKLGLNIQ